MRHIIGLLVAFLFSVVGAAAIAMAPTLKSCTAWVGVGTGALFFDADGDGAIIEKREFVFTEWDPNTASDIEALASRFDSNGDGVLDANDAEFASFQVMVANADRPMQAKTLDELGIASIDLAADCTMIELLDGSVITRQTTFTKPDGSTGTVVDVVLFAKVA